MRTLTTDETVNDGEGLDAVRAAYRETMMAVPHYETEYGEALVANVKAELGPDLAAALTEAPALTPGLAEQIQVAVADAIAQRSQVTQLLESEQTALSDLIGALQPIQRELDGLEFCAFERWATRTLREEYDRLLSARQRCDTLANERQHRRKALSEASTLPELSTTEGYLYRSLETDYPGLAAIAVISERLRSMTEDLHIELLSRDCPPRDGLLDSSGTVAAGDYGRCESDTERRCD